MENMGNDALNPVKLFHRLVFKLVCWHKVDYGFDRNDYGQTCFQLVYDVNAIIKLREVLNKMVIDDFSLLNVFKDEIESAYQDSLKFMSDRIKEMWSVSDTCPFSVIDVLQRDFFPMTAFYKEPRYHSDEDLLGTWTD